MKEALLVIDMQNYFHKGIAGQLMDKTSEKINEIVGICRDKGIPIVWISHSNKRMGLVEGKDCFEYIDSIKPVNDEIKITKTYGNGFKKTDLNKILKEKGVDTLYLCGFAAEGCVHNTYKGAKKLKYRTWKIEDAIASNSKLLLRVYGKLGESIASNELKLLLS
jgi:nicotinamidase-related amidase